MTEQDLRNVLEKVRPLMGKEGDRLVNSYVNESTGSDDAMGKMLERRKYSAPQQEVPLRVSPNCKVPKAIQEAMTKNPISTPGMSGSVLDDIGYRPEPKETSMLRETTSAPTYQQPLQAPQYPQQYPVPQIALDYNYIRAIVNECIQNNLSQIKEQVKNELLKESELRTIRLAEGNKIQLIDNKSNLYESTLAFKKNISKK